MDYDLKYIYVYISLRAHLKYVPFLPILCVGIIIISSPVFIFVRALFKLFIYCMSCFVMEITVNKYTYMHRMFIDCTSEVQNHSRYKPILWKQKKEQTPKT